MKRILFGAALLAVLVSAAGGRLERAQKDMVITVAASDATATHRQAADYACDGTNDEVQIQAAIDAVNTAGGGIVQLSEGTFEVDNAIALKSYVTLRGRSKRKTILNFATHTTTDTSHPVITNENYAADDINTDITIENLYVDGNKGTASGGAGTDPSSDGQDGWNTTAFPDHGGQGNRGALHFWKVTGLVVRNCYVYDPWCTAIELEVCDDFLIEGNRIDKPSDDGIGVNYLSNNGVVRGNYITNVALNRDYGESNGIEVQDGAYNVSIAGNVIASMTAANANKAIALNAHGAVEPYNISIVGNVIADIKRGIYVGSDTYSVTICGNTIVTDSSEGLCGILLGDCTNVAITGNTINAPGNGVELIQQEAAHTSTDVAVVGNTFNNSTGTGSCTGIRVDGTMTRWIIADNIFTVDYTGIYIDSGLTATDVRIRGNTFTGGSNGILAKVESTYSRCVIEQNNFSACTRNIYFVSIPASVQSSQFGNAGVQVRDNLGHLAPGDIVTISQNMDHADITDGAGAVGTYAFTEAIPAGCRVLSVSRDIHVAFKDTVGNNTEVKVTLGDGTDVDRWAKTAATGDDIWNSTTDAAWGFGDFQGTVETSAAKTPTVTFTTDSDVTELISGAGAQGTMTIYITYQKL